MFKKTLVAVSLLAAFSASAITVNHDGTKYTDASTYSAEGIALSDVTTVNAPALEVALQAATYLENYTITLTFTGAEFNIASGLPDLAIIGVDAAGTQVDVATNSTASAPLTLVSASDNSATYKLGTVVAAKGTEATKGFTGSLLVVDTTTALAAGSFVFSADSISGDVSVKVTANRADGSSFDDEGKDNPTVLKSKEELSGEVKSTDDFDGVIDVNTLRTTFESNGLNDTLKLTTALAAADLNGVTVTKVAYTVKGDFSFLDSDTTKDDIQLYDSSRVAVSSSPADLKVEADKITWSATDVGTPTLTINVTDKDGKAAPAALDPQEFTASADVTYKVATKTATKSVMSGTAAGKWTLNGAQASIPSMPFGDAYAQYITVSNTSDQEGDISVDMYIDGVKSTHTLDTKSAKQAVTNISADLRALVAEAGATDANVAFDIVVNAPSDDVLVTALYYVKADADRAVMGVVNK